MSLAGSGVFLVPLLKVFAGLALLAGGGEVLVSGAMSAARKMGVRPLVVGVTVVAFGTSMPELFVSINAAINDHPGIMLGNVIGSNTANIGLVLAIAAMLSPLAYAFGRIRLEMGLVLAATLACWGAALAGFFPRWLGLLMFATIVAYTRAAVRNRHNEDGCDANEKRPLPAAALMVAAGLAALAWGSDVFIDGAAELARVFGVGELFIGLTVAAVGTSLPELASSLAAVRRGEHEILIGNIVGSNMFNLLMVLAASGIVTPFAMEDALWQRDVPVMFFFSAAVAACLYFAAGMKRWHGALLFVVYIAYILSLA